MDDVEVGQVFPASDGVAKSLRLWFRVEASGDGGRDDMARAKEVQGKLVAVQGLAEGGGSRGLGFLPVNQATRFFPCICLSLVQGIT